MKDKAFVLQGKPLTFTTFLLVLSEMLMCLHAPFSSLLLCLTLPNLVSGCPSSYCVGCKLHLSLGFAECGIYLQSYFPSFSWLFLHNIKEKRGKCIELHCYVYMGSTEFWSFFNLDT